MKADFQCRVEPVKAHSLRIGSRRTWVRQVIPEGEDVCLLGKEIPVLTYKVRINPGGAVRRRKRDHFGNKKNVVLGIPWWPSG